MNDLVYFNEDGNIVVTGVRLVCGNTLVLSEPCWTETAACSNPRPTCPHCGCSYFVFGDSPLQGICHDCGRLFEVEPAIDMMTRCVENKSQE